MGKRELKRKVTLRQSSGSATKAAKEREPGSVPTQSMGTNWKVSSEGRKD